MYITDKSLQTFVNGKEKDIRRILREVENKDKTSLSLENVSRALPKIRSPKKWKSFDLKAPYLFR